MKGRAYQMLLAFAMMGAVLGNSSMGHLWKELTQEEIEELKVIRDAKRREPSRCCGYRNGIR